MPENTPTPATDITRADDVNHFVALDALAEVVSELVHFVNDFERRQDDGLFGPIDANDLDVMLDSPGVGSRSLHQSLWTDDEEGNSLDWYKAAERSARIEGEVFKLLAGPLGQEWLVERAMDASARRKSFSRSVEDLSRA